MNRTQVSGADGQTGETGSHAGGTRSHAGGPDGRAAAIRPTRPADLQALSEFFTGLSTRTRYLRFFAPVTPGPAMLSLLSGDSGTADALIAIRNGAIIGHAMAVDRARSPQITDIGVVVADAWQGQGVGSALTSALVTRARARGVTAATMDVLPGNQKALAMIVGHWPAAQVTRSPDCTTIRCPLPRPAPIPRPAPVGHAQPATIARAIPLTSAEAASGPLARSSPVP